MSLLSKNKFLKVILHYFQQKTSKRGIDIEGRQALVTFLTNFWSIFPLYPLKALETI